MNSKKQKEEERRRKAAAVVPVAPMMSPTWTWSPASTVGTAARLE